MKYTEDNLHGVTFRTAGTNYIISTDRDNKIGYSDYQVCHYEDNQPNRKNAAEFLNTGIWLPLDQTVNNYEIY